MNKVLIAIVMICFSTSAFAARPARPSNTNKLCGNDYTAKYYDPYNGRSDVITLWDAGNYWSNPDNLPIDHQLSIAIIFVNYVTNSTTLNVEITQRDLQGNIVPFNSSQPTVRLPISVGACSSGQTGVGVYDEAPAGEYILSAKVIGSSQPGADLRIHLN